MYARFRQAIILVSTFLAIFYIVYRGLYTLNLTSTYAVFASLFLYSAEIYGVINMLLFFLQVWEVYEAPQQPVLEGRTVDVFVPTYNEDPDLLRITIQACKAMDYPHRTIVCDDGKRPAVEALCNELGVDYFIRPDNKHAKAGNLNHAFGKTSGEFLIIFDADHVPEKNFITRLLGYFAEEKLAFVQTPHAYYNFDSFQARLNHKNRQYWEEGQLFYHVIQPGRNKYGCPIFAGSAAMFRRSALAEVGYIAVETITEDMHTGLRMHAKGWKSMGCSARLVAGQAPQDVTTFHTQRLRWGEGNLSVLAHDNPLTMKGLTFGQRLCYLATMINWAGGIFKLGIYLTPLLMLFTGVPPVNEFTWTLAIIMGFYMVACIFGTKIASNGYGSVWYSELFTMASFWTQIRGTMRAMFLRKFQQFVVTSKRGRQSKSIWPFIRPHVYLIALSVIALSWAWGRLYWGISDDYFKPVLASFWTCFHMLLAYLVVRRAFWPEDRRFSTRHSVNLPITYEVDTPDGPIQDIATTADLNELGTGIVGYQTLPDGAALRMEIHAPGQTIYVKGQIRTTRRLAHDPHGPAGPMEGYRYGIQFTEVDKETTDALNLLCLQFAVPKLYALYEVGHEPPLQMLYRRLMPRFVKRRLAKRHEYRLPVFLNVDKEETIPTVTEDLSRNAMSLLLGSRIEAGDKIAFMMMTPVGPLRGVAKVLRAMPREYGARTYYLTVLEFQSLEGNGRSMIQTLFESGLQERWSKVLDPYRDPLDVPMDKPLGKGLLYAVPMMLVAFAIFRWEYRDDFFLRGLMTAGQPPSVEEVARIDRIFKSTMQQGYPSTDRLVLLGYVMQHLDRRVELAEVTKLLAPRDKGNLDLQVALAHAFDLQENFNAAESEYQRLLREVDRGRLPEARRQELLAGAARTAVHAGKLDIARERFRKLLKQYPDQMDLRNEFAGVLLNSKRYQDAVQVYDGVEPNYEGRVLLVMIHTAAQDWVNAEQEARALVAQRPDDLTAQGLLADVLTLQGNYRQARAIYERLLKTEGADLKIAVQLAHLSLWSKNYDEALDRFQAIVDQHLENGDFSRRNPHLLKAYVNAAASAGSLGAPQQKMAIALAERITSLPEHTDPVFLARLSWVLHRLQQFDHSSALLERALALDPADRSIRMQLAGVLVAGKRPNEALKLLEGRESSLDARQLLVDIYLMNKDTVAAEKECRALLKDNPDHVPLKMRLATTLALRKDFVGAIKIYEELAQKDPDDRHFPIKIADITLWSGDFAGALSKYQALLAKDFNQPDLWWGLIDASAGAKELSESQKTLVLAIFDHTLRGEHKGPRAVDIFAKEGKPFKEENFLTRQAWTLHQMGDDLRACKILDLAMGLRILDPADRRELSGVLSSVQRYRQALKMYEGLTLETTDYLPLARLHAALEEFPEASKRCEQFLSEHPLNKEAQRLHADLLSWQGRHGDALIEFARLVRQYPTDLDLKRRQAEITLWNGEPGLAFQMYGALLKDNWDQETLWPGYLEAAARSDAVGESDKELLRKVADQPMGARQTEVAFLGHLALVRQRHLGDKSQANDLMRRALHLPALDSTQQLRLGWTLHQLGDRLQGNKLIDQVITAKPKQTSVRKELADVLTAVQRFTEALAMVDELLIESPKDVGLKIRQAELTLWSGAPDQAIERLRLALESQPTLWTLKRSFIDAAALAQRLSPAQLDLVHRLAQEPAPDLMASEQTLFFARLSWVLRREGERTGAQHLIEKSEGLLDLALAVEPADAKTKLEIAGLLAASGRGQRALAWLEEIAKANPGDLNLKMRLAEVSLAAGQYERAMDLLHELLVVRFDQPMLWARFVDAAAGAPKGMNPEHLTLALRISEQTQRVPQLDRGTLMVRLAWVMQREEQTTKATQLLDQALTLEAKDPKIRRELADGILGQGRFAQAVTLLEELARENPNDQALHVKLAQATLWSGNRSLGITRLQKLLEINFEQPALWSTFVDAVASLNKGEVSREQMKLLQKLADRPIRTDPDQVLFLSRLAWVLYREQDDLRAKALLDQAFAANPSDAKIRRELAGVLAATGRAEQALKMFEGVELKADERFQLVVLHAAAKQFAEAQKQCQEILAGNPGDTKARQWLADVTLWNTQYDQALAQFTQLLGANFDQPTIWPGFIEAAVNVRKLNRVQVRLIEQIARRGQKLPFVNDQGKSDIVHQARLALALNRHVEQPLQATTLAAALVGSLADPFGPKLFEACAVFAEDQGRVTPGRKLLAEALVQRPAEASILAKLGWIAFQMGARREAAVLLDEARHLDPREPAVRREVGDTLIATQRLRDAQVWFEDLAAVYPRDAELQMRLAEITVWSGDYQRGLDRITPFLSSDFQNKRLWHTFVDAASSAAMLTDAQTAIIRKLADQPAPVAEYEALYLSRLAWVLHREGTRVKDTSLVGLSDRLLDRALTLTNTPAEARLEIAGVLSARQRFPEAVRLFEELAREFPERLDLQARLAEATVWKGDFALGLQRLHKVLEQQFDQPSLWRTFIDASAGATWMSREQMDLFWRIARQRIPTQGEEQTSLLSRQAWVLLREGKKADLPEWRDQAAVWLEQAVALSPKDASVRRELGGVLTAAGKTDAALGMFQGLDLTLDDRFQLVVLHSAKKDFAQAEAELRRVLAERPADDRALQWQAQILVWKGDYEQGLIAHQKLLSRKFDQPELWRSFVDAAAGAKALTSEQGQLLAKIAQEPSGDKSDALIYQMRAAAALARTAKQLNNDTWLSQANRLLDETLKAAPGRMDNMRELAGVLASAGRNKAAAELLEKLPNPDFADRALLASIYSAEQNFDAAERIARRQVEISPDDTEALYQLASILSWNQKAAQALPIFEKLAQKMPGDPRLEGKLAETSLWSGAFDRALERYRLLVVKSPSPDAWRGYLDAAASAKNLDLKKDKALVIQAPDELFQKASTDGAFLARYAWVLERLGESERGLKLLRQALALNENNREIRIRLAETLSALGKTEEAETHYRILLGRPRPRLSANMQ